MIYTPFKKKRRRRRSVPQAPLPELVQFQLKALSALAASAAPRRTM